VQLVNAQKLEAIGQLAAGIAHEINTPIQYIGDNTHFLSDSFSGMAPLLQVYGRMREHLVNCDNIPSDITKEIATLEKNVDFAFLCEEIPKAISQSLEGVARVSAIVRAMKDFSHPGTKEKTPVNIADVIGSAVTISRNEWKYVADVVTRFDPSLPHVPVIVGEFNQVMLNLIVNAAHAIGDVGANSGVSDKGVITISAKASDGHMEIRIADTGTGIPENIHAKIFDPFFTTKKVGKGTGQGLAIARSIIEEKHGGRLSFETELGKGTVFMINLPLDSEGEISDGLMNGEESEHTLA
jgi:signal transduction histidine kinase